MIYADKEKAAEKIAKVFEQMGWHWYESFKPDEVAIVESLKEKEKTLLSNSACSNIRSGRVFAEKLGDTGQIVYGLERESCDEWINWCENNLPV